jgi:glycosyltransferase involved in cell wall biosynthesis
MVSIGVPVYNGAAYLGHALATIRSQTYPNIEIVISDNASTDGTEALCRALAAEDPRIRYERLPRNRGLVPNHRNVLAMATGEYFMFAPYDDYFAPTYIERCVELLEREPQHAYVVAKTVLVDAEGERIGVEVPRQRLDDPSPSVRFWDVLIVQGGINFYGLARRAMWNAVGAYVAVPRGERIIIAELALNGTLGVLAADLYFRRIHGGQITALRRDRRAEIQVLDPNRRSGLARSVPVILAQYFLGYVAAIGRAPVPLAERMRAFRGLLRWFLRSVPGFAVHDARTKDLEIDASGTGVLPEGRLGIGY